MDKNSTNESLIVAATDARILIVDDDEILASRLAKALSQRGYDTKTAHTIESAMETCQTYRPTHAVVDLRLNDQSGLNLVENLRKILPECRIVMLTAFGNIATAVAAVKAGAIDYLSKPADADTVVRSLFGGEEDLPLPPSDPMPADRVRWEHIQRVYELCERNVSETARRLKMHRRTLQRILAKHAPREHASFEDDEEE